MKARMVCLCALVCFVTAGGSVCGQPLEETEQQVVNLGLADVDEIYVRIVADGIIPENLEDEISNRLSQNNLEVIPADVNKFDEHKQQKMTEVLKKQVGPSQSLKVYMFNTPELIVRISVLQGLESGPCVYHAQTSFAREVYLRGPRARTKAEVWRIDVPVNIAEESECGLAIKTSVLRQVDAFIADFKRVNAVRTTTNLDEPQNDTAESVKQQQDKLARQRKDYEYVASKNSKVFHKSDCRAAARISSENLIGFNSREEAVHSGRRPCKICKP